MFCSSQTRPAIGSQSPPVALFRLVGDWNLLSFLFECSCMLSHVVTPPSQRLITCIVVSKLLFECYQLPTMLLECLIVVDALPLEANLLQSLDPVWGEIGTCFHSLICCSHVATPLSQWWFSWKCLRNIAVSKLYFASKELMAASIKPYFIIFFRIFGAESIEVGTSLFLLDAFCVEAWTGSQ